MAERMLRFVDVDRRLPEKRAAEARRADFDEIYARFQPAEGAQQSARCSQCGVPFCQIHCPLHNNIPDWLKLAAEGRMEEAYAVSAATNNMPEICGRICPQDRLCEGNCVIEPGFGGVTIGSVETYITETAWDEGWIRPVTPRREREESVGIIGAGPAGLAAAEQLRRKGVQVMVYDRYDRIGGLLVYGIPNFKLEKHIVERRASLLKKSGVRFELNFDIGIDESFEEVRSRHDAILIATGVYKARGLEVPGLESDGIVPALDYLVTSNREGFGDPVPDYDNGRLNADGHRVVVIGGGDTAMDCVRTAVRQGAKSVKCLYRRDRENMPGSQREVANAEEEGVEFIWLAKPDAFFGSERVEGLKATRMRLGAPDETGRRRPEPMHGDRFTLDCDLAIKALGFEPEDLPAMFGCPDLITRTNGTLKVDPNTLMTSLDGVFAAGDIVRGASLVVWAIRDGREASASILSYLNARAEAQGKLEQAAQQAAE